jgi:hypothetical protein
MKSQNQLTHVLRSAFLVPCVTLTSLLISKTVSGPVSVCEGTWAMRIVSPTTDTLHRSRFSSLWKRAFQSRPLCEGDVVFLPSNSSGSISKKTSVSLEAIDGSLKVELGEGSLFHIQKSMPSLSRVSSLSSRRMRGATPSPADELAEMFVNTTDTKGIRITQEVRLVQVEEPKSDTTLLSDHFPAPISVRVSTAEQSKDLWAHVWDKDGNKVLSLAFHEQTKISVPFPKPGRYRMQVMSANESRVSRSYTIETKSKKESLQSLSDLLLSTSSDLTVVIQ